jgi:Ser/Thr protein kinase RdoA (MazF antagonist)
VSIVRERLEFTQKCAAAAVEHDWDRLARENPQFPWANDVRSFVRKSTNYIDHVKNSLLPWVEAEVPRQPVLRDIWSDHLFFDENRVCGLIDFHAIGAGTVAGDIGRLLASWQLPYHEATWTMALAEYEAVRPLAPEEQTLLSVLDDAARVLTPWVWLTWVLLEKREFPIGKMNSRVSWSLRRFFQWDV